LFFERKTNFSFGETVGYRAHSKGSYGDSGHRRFGRFNGRGKNWDDYPLTGTANGDFKAHENFRNEAEDRLFIKSRVR
jgi:hypothetical protein